MIGAWRIRRLHPKLVGEKEQQQEMSMAEHIWYTASCAPYPISAVVVQYTSTHLTHFPMLFPIFAFSMLNEE